MVRKQLPEDFKDFIKFLNSNEVKYLLIGGWAVGLYGHPRATNGIDFLIAIDNENLNKMIKTLSDFGGPTAKAKHLRKPGSVFRMGSPPVQIDIINEASGIVFEDCYNSKLLNCVKGEMSRQELQGAAKLKHRDTFTYNYLKPALETGLVERTIPEKPNSRLQKYRLTLKGKKLIKKAKGV